MEDLHTTEGVQTKWREATPTRPTRGWEHSRHHVAYTPKHDPDSTIEWDREGVPLKTSTVKGWGGRSGVYRRFREGRGRRRGAGRTVVITVPSPALGARTAAIFHPSTPRVTVQRWSLDPQHPLVFLTFLCCHGDGLPNPELRCPAPFL